MINLPAKPSVLRVLAEPIVFPTCPVCDTPHETTQIAVFGDETDIMVNECCDSCWQWFRMEEFAITVRSNRPWAPVLDPSNPQGLWTDEQLDALSKGTV